MKSEEDEGRMNSDGYSGMRSYMADIGRLELLTPEGTKDLFRRMRDEKDEAARAALRDRIIRGNLRYVVKVVMDKYRDIGERMENIQCGNQGLVKAVDKYRVDRKRVCDFLPFAYNYICTEIRRGSLDRMHVVRMGTRCNKSEERKAADRLTVLSLDAETGDEGDGPTLAEKVSGRVGGMDELMDKSDREYMGSLLGGLRERERRMVCMKFGIGFEKPMTLESIGAEFGVSKQDVFNIIEGAKQRMRAMAAGELR